MLDIGLLKKQISEMFKETVNNKNVIGDKFKNLFIELKKWENKWESLKEKVETARTSWLLATPVELEDIHFNVLPRPKELTVIATDGSQIFPDHHEISSSFLINIGSVVIHYGTKERPLLTSEPYLYYKDEDIYEQVNGKKISINTSIVSARRGLMEMEKLAYLLIKHSERENILGILDGTLILWTLEGSAPDFKNKILSSFIKCLDKLKKKKLPIASYISRPRTNDVINTLRVGLCPQKTVNCDNCPWKNELFLPCSSIEGLTDAHIFKHILKEGERSALFETSSNIISLYGEHKILFFYINTGQEICRVEIPQWVYEDEILLALTHSGIFDQIKKGGGYPVVLSEAHEKAVIKNTDREIFYRMISDTLVDNKLPLSMSAKKSSKERARI